MPTGTQYRGDIKPNYRELTENCKVIVALWTSDSKNEKKSFRLFEVGGYCPYTTALNIKKYWILPTQCISAFRCLLTMKAIIRLRALGGFFVMFVIQEFLVYS